MPASSSAQQRFFGMVHAYQLGKISDDKVNAKVRHVARHISSQDAKDFASTKTKLPETIVKIFHSPEYIEETLQEITKTNNAGYIKGTLIDVYTANMLLTVYNRLSDVNRKSLCATSINEMVSIAYKVLTS